VKELLNIRPDQIELHAQVPDKKVRIVKKLFPLPGHRTFELELKTGMINEVVPISGDAAQIIPNVNIVTGAKSSGVNTIVKKKIIKREGCLYCTALNAENADKEFHRMLNKPFKKKK
jgi:hypothetical protein